MQVRLFREPEGTFQVVCSPRRRTGLVPIIFKGLTKEQVKIEVLKLSLQEGGILDAIRAAKEAAPAP